MAICKKGGNDHLGSLHYFVVSHDFSSRGEVNSQIEQVERLAHNQSVQLENSYAGQIGKAIEPIFAPLGFDWKISIGIVSSFAAREVIVSTLSVLYGVGDGGGESKDSLYDALRTSTWEDGSPVFTWPASLSLLVFYILAMQCLPTLVVTLRETGAWRWPLIQFGYMSLLAYIAAWITYRVAMLVAANGGIPI